MKTDLYCTLPQESVLFPYLGIHTLYRKQLKMYKIQCFLHLFLISLLICNYLVLYFHKHLENTTLIVS